MIFEVVFGCMLYALGGALFLLWVETSVGLLRDSRIRKLNRPRTVVVLLFIAWPIWLLTAVLRMLSKD